MEKDNYDTLNTIYNTAKKKNDSEKSGIKESENICQVAQDGIKLV